MKILWLTWKDPEHPLAGGAEVVLRELCTRLVRDQHEVTLLTTSHVNAQTAAMPGLTIIRVGSNRYLHSFQALAHYLRRMRNKFDIVIEVVNTAPYLSALFGGRTPVYLFYHQLAREIWFHEAVFPLNRLGYHVLEPTATRLLSRTKTPVITVSDSTKQDLVRYGFRPDTIRIISEGTELQPVDRLDHIEKYDRPTMLSLGAIRPMKRTLDQVKAFEIAKQSLPELQLIIAGDDSSDYGQKVVRYCQQSPFAQDITCLGRVSMEQKLELMRRAHVITVTSIKEGWGLIVTEAASQGTPAVVYDVDGLRDSVRQGETGIVTESNSASLAGGVIALLDDKARYQRLREAGWQWSQTITFDQSYQDFKQALELI